MLFASGQLCEVCSPNCTTSETEPKCKHLRHSCSTCLHSCSGPDLSSCQQQPCSRAETHCQLVAGTNGQFIPTCFCPPGYMEYNQCTAAAVEGNTTATGSCSVCIDSCHGYCFNSGLCSHTGLEHGPECRCTGVYTGRQCNETCYSCDVNGTGIHTSIICHSTYPLFGEYSTVKERLSIIQ